MTNLETIPWIADILKAHPELKDEVSEPYGDLKNKEALEKELNKIFHHPEIDTTEKQIKALNDFRARYILRIAVNELVKDLPLMKVSDHLTYLAEAILKVVIESVWNSMIGEYGTPTCVIDNNMCDMGFIVVGYGKFGGLEIGYTSDLDLVFLHAGNWQDTQGGERNIDSNQFYIKMGQQVIKILGGQTLDGALYETDMRLRPDGTKGLLVQTIESYRNYLIERAWTWEHQALVRARAITGDPQVIKRFDEIRAEVLSMGRDEKNLAIDVKDMREKMAKELDKIEKGFFNLKQGRGGIIDIEFLVQYLTLLHAGKNPKFKLWPDVVRLLGSMVHAGILDEVSAQTLKNAYLIYRFQIHRLSLQKASNIVENDKFVELRKRVKKIYDYHLN
jgi:glutamate-ammonia-ligase adenylyltransferase